MAENKTINIKINQNADKAEKSFKSYNKELGNTKKQYDAVLKSGKPFDQQLEDINRIVKETPLNVRDMNKQIQAYQSIALSAGRETPVGRKALEEAAQLRDRYIDIQNETKRLADDQRTLEGAMQGVATGVAVYGGIQSAMALSGVESEKLRETLVKLQAAQTLMNSINQVATAFEKESALMLTLKSAKTKALTMATAAYATVTGTTTGLLKAFRIALASTGIGLIVVAIGLLIANFDKLIKVFQPVIDGFKAVGEAIGLVGESEEELEKAREEREQKEIERTKARIARKKKLREIEERETQRIDQIEQNLFNSRQNRLNREISLQEAQGKDATKLREDQLKEQIEFYEREAKIRKKRVDEAKLDIKLSESIPLFGGGAEDQEKEAKALTDALQDYQNFVDARAAASNNLKILRINNRKEDLNNYKEYSKTRQDIARQIEDLENSLLEDGIEKELEINRDKFRRLREDAEKNTKLTRDERKKIIDLYDKQELAQQKVINQKYIDLEKQKNAKIDEEKAKANKERIDKEDALFELELSLMKDRQMAEIIALTQQYDKKFELANGNAELERQLTEQQEADIAAIQDKYRKEKEAKDEESRKKERAKEQALQDYKINVVQGGLSAINDIAELFAKGNEKQQKRAFQIQKAVGIAQATINTAQAITKVFAETTDFTPTQSLRIANAVAIGVAGAAQIASIASQQFQGGGDVETPTDIGGGAGGEAVAPQFNVVGDSGINQLAQLQQQPTMAYVVSGEVTSAQALDRNRVTNATL